MTWLATQVWFLMLAAFLAGALVTYVVLGFVLTDVNKIDTHPSDEAGER
jgi:hypothetical protein